MGVRCRRLLELIALAKSTLTLSTRLCLGRNAELLDPKVNAAPSRPSPHRTAHARPTSRSPNRLNPSRYRILDSQAPEQPNRKLTRSGTLLSRLGERLRAMRPCSWLQRKGRDLEVLGCSCVASACVQLSCCLRSALELRVVLGEGLGIAACWRARMQHTGGGGGGGGPNR